MAIERLSQASILTLNKYSSMMAGSVASDFELIGTTILGSTAASVTFSGLGAYSSAYRHLQLRMTYVSNNGASGTYVRGQFNGDTGANYSQHFVYGQGSSALSGGNASITGFLAAPISGTTNSSAPDTVVIDLLDFASTSKTKVIRALAGHGSGTISLSSSGWFNTSAVTSMTLLAYSQGTPSTFGAGARFSLYGLRG